jgi:predicted HTH transcriptional regulator
VLKHLKLYSSGMNGGLTNSAILLFGREPQRFCISSEIKCVQWYGQERHKPMLSYQIYKGTLFDMADAAVAFVLSKLDLRVGTRDNCIEADREYEIPSSAVAEAIINAVAHRDYVSSGSVQVELFSDRLVVRNPGTINPALTKKDLFIEHASYPNNSLIADQLYQTKHIEKFGTGLTDLIEDCRKAITD